MQKHPVTGQFVPKPDAPRVVGADPLVTPPVLRWLNGPAPKDAAAEYGSPAGRSEIISEACIRSTVQGGTIPQHAADIASERGVKLDPSRGLP